MVVAHCPSFQGAHRTGRWNGVSSLTRNLYNDEIYYVDFLFLEGDMRGALVTVNDLAAARRVIDNAPAWLYQKPRAPLLRREVGEEILMLQWPPDQPVTHRLPPLLLMSNCSLEVRLDNVEPQDEPIGVVFLCRRPAQAELDSWRGY